MHTTQWLDAFRGRRLPCAHVCELFVSRGALRDCASCCKAKREKPTPMTRSILVALAASFLTAVVSGTGCAATGIGDPCVPEQEYLPDFRGFNLQEVSVESKSFQCQTRLCLVNHFQGRVSCTYGQGPDGTNAGVACKDAKGNTGGCITPGIPQVVTTPVDANGNPTDTEHKKTVFPQCSLRTADKAVYCSCRCANLNNQTNDGANYCTCPDGFDCTQLVTSIGVGNEGLTGAYCVKHGTQFDQNKSPCGVECNSLSTGGGNCGKPRCGSN
jgi:hypothetical protein